MDPNPSVMVAKKIPIIILALIFWVGGPIKYPSKKPDNTCAHPYHFLMFTPKAMLYPPMSTSKIISQLNKPLIVTGSKSISMRINSNCFEFHHY
jgi:hypothetical protein